jgi:hypothetical protein
MGSWGLGFGVLGFLGIRVGNGSVGAVVSRVEIF